ncbi:kelch repeat-containing protein [Georgenia sp. MJ170]|uniref:kelch repeat-containing protein n=1 Tax=Georgenia sunbinii TaxID=3117728 RepID=UPI002F262F63
MSRTSTRAWAALSAAALVLTLLGLSAAPIAAADEGAQVSFSLDRKRTSPVAMAGAVVDGLVYPFLTGDDGVTAVSWYLDDPEMAGEPLRVDTTSPFDFSPGSVAHASAPFDTATLPDGEHVITAQVSTGGGTLTHQATFVTDNDVEALLTTSTPGVALTMRQGGQPPTATVDVGTSDGIARPFTAVSTETWLSVTGGGTTPSAVTLVAATDLPLGTHRADVIVESPDLPSVSLPVTLTVQPAAIDDYTVVYSADPKRTSPARLNGATVEGDVYPLLAPEADVASTSWWLDDPAMGGEPVRTDTVAPYDYAPGSVRHRAEPLPTATLPDGEHTITVLVVTTDGAQEVRTAAFTTDNGSNTVTWEPETLVVEAEEGDGPLDRTARLTATDASTVATLSSDAAWLTADFPTGALPVDVALTIDPTGLPGGTHTGRVTATADGALSAVLTVSLVVDAAPGLIVDPASLALSATEGTGPVDATLSVVASDGSSMPVQATVSADWLAVDPSSTVTPAQITATADPSMLPLGDHTADVTLSSPGLPDVVVPVTFEVSTEASLSFDVVYSLHQKRGSPQPLTGTTVSGVVYPFLGSADDVSSTSWWLDDPERTGQPLRVDSTVPFDFTPGSVTHAAAPFDTAGIRDGQHTITVEVLAADGTTHVSHATFLTANATSALSWSESQLDVAAPANGAAETHTLELTATAPGTVADITSNTSWLRASVNQATTPATVDVTIEPGGLTEGVWRGELVASAPGTFSATFAVTLVVGDPGDCAPVACSLIKVGTPYNLGFRYDAGNIIDTNGTGTGFTTLLPRPDGSEFKRDRIAVNLGEGTLDVTGTQGSVKENTLDNALGVGFDGPSATTVISATIAGPPPASGKFEQAGVWFGYDQDHVDRIALVHTSTGWRVEHVLEVDGTEVARRNSPTLTIPSDVPIELSLRVDPSTRQVTGSYKVGDAGVAPLRSFDVPGEFFSFDGAGIDPVIGTRSFGGIFASQRGAAQAPVFRFSQFAVTGERDPSNIPDFPFDRSSVDVQFPTSLAYGPDGRLYVQSMFGKIYVLSFAADGSVTDTQVVSTLGTRLALGLTIDPASTAEDVIVWAGHSSPSASNGIADSGVVSRLSGPGLTQRTDVITGLPRSFANHGTNSIAFGADGRLYLAQGGNTGAGAPNTANTEFGERGEQPLSAALLVADVTAPGFDGDCAHPTDIYLSGDCDVDVFSSGLRNTYDFVEHSNGLIYGPDNGLGIVGSFPTSPVAPCTGFGSTAPWSQGGGNPGNQNDVLNVLEEGRYYGHPNPARDECVFKNGSYQGVDPLPTFTEPLQDLGPNRSANGIIEFSGDAFCGALDHDLLITNYSVGDDITAVKLASDGRSVVTARSIIGGFKDPLPIAQLPDGRIVVGEFAGGQVTFLTPRDTGCWESGAPLPVSLLDAGGATVDGAMYVVGGKGSAGHSTQAYRYDTATDGWARIADLPGVGVENPAITTADGKVLVLGGSTAPFSGAVASAWSYDPGTDAWQALPDMPTARGGATAQVLDGSVYVAGGMTSNGASTDVVERFDLASGTWSTVPAMAVARDNPGSAVVDDVLYVFGGRTRLANGQSPAPTLGSVEAFDLATGTWQERAPLPTPRRTMGTGVVDGRVVLAGGEAQADGSPFDTTELYDPVADEWSTLRRMPTGRHGAAAAVVDGRLHLVGGGTAAGASWSSLHEVLQLPDAP